MNYYLDMLKIVFHIFCDLIYYVSIYYIPMFTYIIFGFDLEKFKDLFQLPYICLQFQASEDIAKKIFHTICLCNPPSIKYLCHYSSGSLQNIVIYHNDIDSIMSFVHDIEQICYLKYSNTSFYGINSSHQSTMTEYLWIYMIFATLNIMLLRYKFSDKRQYNYLYCFTSIFMAISGVLLFAGHICFKYNLTPNMFYLHYTRYLIRITMYLFTMYIVDTILLLLNIRKHIYDDQN